MISLILGIVLFALTIPIRGMLLTLKMRKMAMVATGNAEGGLASRLSKGVSKARTGQSKKEKITAKQKKAKELAIKALEWALRGLKLLLNFIRMCIAMLSTLIISGGVFALVMITAVIIGGVSSAGLVTATQSNSSTASKSSGGSSESSVSSTVDSAEVKKIINMKDKEVWNLISDGNFKSYDEANQALKTDTTKWKSFWTNNTKTVKVKCHKWNSEKKEKYDTEVNITVNKHLTGYFSSFMKELYDAGYIIDTVGGFCVRTKNNNSGSGNWSAHSFGAVLDINWNIPGMSSVPIGGDGYPRKTYKNLSEPRRSELCTYDSDWLKISKKYKLDWGGYWSPSYLDPMHFSLVGDNNKDTRTYKPKYEGK